MKTINCKYILKINLILFPYWFLNIIINFFCAYGHFSLLFQGHILYLRVLLPFNHMHSKLILKINCYFWTGVHDNDTTDIFLTYGV